MKKQLSIYLILFAVFMQAFSVWGIESEGETIHLVILHINDTHGRLRPYDTAEAKNIGGIARVATKIKEIREANEGRTLVLHAGDVFSRGDQPTVLSGGEVNVLAMDIIGYDAFVPGNGEYYFGVGNLMRQMALAKFPVLAANVFYKKNGERLFKPYIIKEVAGIKVAILGLGFVRLLHPSGWFLDLKDPVETAKEYVPMLREKADLVIALTHIGINEDKRLAAAVPQLDIIVGGHSHTKLDKPLHVSGKEGDVIIVQAGDYCKFLGRLDVYLQADQSGKYSIKSTDGKLLPIDSKIKEDPEINSLLETYSEPLSEVICTSEITLENPESGDSPMGNFVAEAMRVIAGADLALLDRGAVQSGIEPGEITRADVCKIHPWRNHVIELNLTGAKIKEILTKQDIFTSGISYTKTDGEVSDMKINSIAVEPDKSYKVAAGEFVLSLVSSLKETPHKETGERVDRALEKYLEQISVIKE